MNDGVERGDRRRANGDEGAALVEFALVAVLLFTLVFGIITFGLLLSFKQDMTRAAAEGARAGAVAFPSSNAEGDARNATGTAVRAFGGSFSTTGCARLGMDCRILAPTILDPTSAPCLGDATHQCVTVELVYNYKDNPLYGDIPLISAFLPEFVTAKSVARVND